LVELLGALAGWATLEKVLSDPVSGPEWAPYVLFWVYLALVLGLLAAIFIDLEFMLLPDPITLGGVAIGLMTAPLRQVPWSDSLIGAAAGFLIVWLPFHVLYQLLRGHPGMGLGDAKLLALAGAWFGWKGALFALLAGAIQGTVVTLAVLAVKGRIEEPKAVQAEREEARLMLARLEGAERKAKEAELAQDPLAEGPGQGLGQARIPFGPFLAISILEYLFIGDALVDAYLGAIGA
jgi:leader peptidase (prepilin peptidase)/N-methyltransferase